MEARYITGKQLIDAQYCTYHELADLCARTKLQAYTDDGIRLFNAFPYHPQFTIYFRKGDLAFLDSYELDKMRKYTLDLLKMPEDRKALFKEFKLFHKKPDDEAAASMHACLVLYDRWKKNNTNALLFPFYIGEAKEFGITEYEHKQYIYKFKFLIADVYNAFDIQTKIPPREKKSYLTMLAAFFYKNGFNPSERELTGKLRGMIQNLGGNLNDKTIRKIREEVQEVMDDLHNSS